MSLWEVSIERFKWKFRIGASLLFITRGCHRGPGNGRLWSYLYCPGFLGVMETWEIREGQGIGENSGKSGKVMKLIMYLETKSCVLNCTFFSRHMFFMLNCKKK